MQQGCRWFFRHCRLTWHYCLCLLLCHLIGFLDNWRLFPGRLHDWVLSLLQTVQKWARILLNKVPIRRCRQEFNDLGKYASTVVDKTRYYLVGDISGWGPQHFFKLRRWETLNHNLLLGLFCFKLPNKVILVFFIFTTLFFLEVNRL